MDTQRLSIVWFGFGMSAGTRCCRDAFGLLNTGSLGEDPCSCVAESAVMGIFYPHVRINVKSRTCKFQL